MDDVSTLDAVIACPTCDRAFRTLRGMKIHLANHDPSIALQRKLSMQAHCASPEARERLSSIAKIAWTDPDRREKMMSSIKRAINEPGVGRRKSAALKASNAKPEVIAKRSASAKLARARDDVKEKHRLASLRPDVIERRSNAMKGALNTDAHRAKLPEILRKRHETMKRDGSYCRRSSKVEDEFYDALCSSLGCENVERAVHVNRWLIDFYVKSCDTYVQFDGVYWHGLDRPITDIENSKHPRDAVIVGTFRRDEERVRWFIENGKRLVRVTDAQFIDEGPELIEKMVRN